ncbi:hypothetical protein A4X09_0g7866, partial [Tilletia walkeri]
MAVPVRRPGRIQLQGLHPFALDFHLIWDVPAQPSRLHEECDHWTLLFKTEQDAVWQPFGPDDLPKAYDFVPNLLPKLKKKAQLDADRKVLHLLTHARRTTEDLRFSPVTAVLSVIRHIRTHHSEPVEAQGQDFGDVIISTLRMASWAKDDNELRLLNRSFTPPAQISGDLRPKNRAEGSSLAMYLQSRMTEVRAP